MGPASRRLVQEILRKRSVASNSGKMSVVPTRHGQPGMDAREKYHGLHLAKPPQGAFRSSLVYVYTLILECLGYFHYARVPFRASSVIDGLRSGSTRLSSLLAAAIARGIPLDAATTNVSAHRIAGRPPVLLSLCSHVFCPYLLM